MDKLKLLAATLVSGVMLSLGPAATATSLEAAAPMPAAVLSSAELETLRVGAAGALPPNCELIEDLEDGSLRLYNVAEDIGEQNDLVSAQPERVQSMANKLREWKTELDARPMTVNPNFDPEKYEQQLKHAHTTRKQQLEEFHRRLLHPTSEPVEGEPVTYRSAAFKAPKKK